MSYCTVQIPFDLELAKSLAINAFCDMRLVSIREHKLAESKLHNFVNTCYMSGHVNPIFCAVWAIGGCITTSPARAVACVVMGRLAILVVCKAP